MILLASKIVIYKDPVTDASQADPVTNTFTLPYFTHCEITSKLDSLTNTATISFPFIRALSVTGSKNDGQRSSYIAGNSTIFSFGQKVQIYGGYDYLDGKGAQTNLLFTGYISNIITGAMIELFCEDAMWKLKQCDNTNYSVTNGSVTLKTLLTNILPTWCSSTMQCIDATLGGYRVNKGTSVAFELDRLKDNGFCFEFDETGILKAGLRYSFTNVNDPELPQFEYETNIISDDNMKYKRSDEIRVCVKAISHDFATPPNVTGPVVIGRTGGQTINYKGNGLTLDTLKTLAQEIYDRTVYEGWAGSFETFLQPQVKAGQAVKLTSTKFPEKNGVYLVNGVESYMGVDGGFQTVYLDKKVA